jgi:diacylglycerol kinase family enzyme
MFYYGQLAILPNGTANFFQMLHTLGEMGAKKAANLFRFTACMCRCNGRWLFSCIGRGYSAKAKLK